jgi:hypothetical protein
MMADELWDTLMRFHREVSLPEIVITLREEIAAFRRETNGHFDKIFKLLDKVGLRERITELEYEI